MTASLSVLMSNVQCHGSEEKLQDCYVAEWDSSGCPSGTEYAAVTCECKEFLMKDKNNWSKL